MQLLQIPDLLATTSAGIIAATGLSMRLPPKSVPLEILNTNGTLPGILLGSALVSVPWFVPGQELYFTTGKGVLTFALGATTLAVVNNIRSS